MSEDNFPNDIVLKRMAELSIEKATQDFAIFARQFAKDLPSGITGQQALEAFANAIENRNKDMYGNKGLTQ